MSDKIRKDLARRELMRAFQRADKRKVAMEYETAQEAFRKNYERLKAGGDQAASHQRFR
jgi:hypothetical protein